MLVRRMKRGGGRLTGQMLADVFGHLRGQVVAHALPWVGARRPEKADAVAAAIGADAVAVGAVVPTMRRLLEKAHAGEIDMSKRVLEDPSFGFGTWAAGFSGLREDLARRAAGGRRPTEPRGGDREYPPMPE